MLPIYFYCRFKGFLKTGLATEGAGSPRHPTFLRSKKKKGKHRKKKKISKQKLLHGSKQDLNEDLLLEWPNKQKRMAKLRQKLLTQKIALSNELNNSYIQLIV